MTVLPLINPVIAVLNKTEKMIYVQGDVSYEFRERQNHKYHLISSSNLNSKLVIEMVRSCLHNRLNNQWYFFIERLNNDSMINKGMKTVAERLSADITELITGDTNDRINGLASKIAINRPTYFCDKDPETEYLDLWTERAYAASNYQSWQSMQEKLSDKTNLDVLIMHSTARDGIFEAQPSQKVGDPIEQVLRIRFEYCIRKASWLKYAKYVAETLNDKEMIRKVHEKEKRRKQLSLV